MSAHTLEVVSARQGVLLVGEPGPLLALLPAAFRAHQLDSFLISPQSGQKLPEDIDFDYVVICFTPEISAWFTLPSLGARLVVAAPLRFAASARAAFPAARLCLYGDLVGDSGVDAPALAAMVDSALRAGEIVVPGEGVVEYSLSSASSVAGGVAAATISPAWSGERTLFAPASLSLLALAHLVAGAFSKKILVRFGPDLPVQSSAPVLGAGDSTILPASPADIHSYIARVQKTAPIVPIVPPRSVAKTPSLAERSPPRPKTHLSNLEFVPRVAPRPRRQFHLPSFPRPRRQLGIAARGLVIAAGLYLGSLAAAVTVTGLTLRSLSGSLGTGPLPSGNSLGVASFCGTYLEASAVALAALPGLNRLAPLTDSVTLLDAYTRGLGAVATASDVEASAARISKYVLGNGNGDLAADISSARLGVGELYADLALLDGSLPTTAPLLVGKYGARYLAVKAKISALRGEVLTTKAMLSTLPDVIGMGSRKKYLVLLQNNMELRPTGGFIGSFALLSFDNGRLYDMPVFDVYQADGQLKGHVEPPQPVKDILGEANWYFRDSNFDPDFPTSARRAEWFIQKEMGETVDGTVGLTMATLQNLLRATGPLTLADYSETVTADNLFSRAELHAEVNFFPGSTQKKEYLSAVADALITRLHQTQPGDTLKLLGALADSLSAKEVQVSVEDPASSRTFATVGWDGALVSAPCPTLSAPCVNDYLMVVDANFGVNKANYYLDRQIADAVTITKDGVVTHDVKIHYTNRATSSAWPAGDYKDYQRLYLPEGSAISGVTVDGVGLASKNYTVANEHGKTVVAYLVGVPVGSSVDVEATYTIPGVVKSGSLYTWYWQKQSGTSVGDPISFSVNYPLYLHPSVIAPAAALSSQALNFSLVNSGDRRASVQFN